MNVHRELEVLRRTYPLSPTWERVDLFSEPVSISGLTIHSVGLLAVSRDGAEVTGSAAAIDAPPVFRAYFELLERASLAELQSAPRDFYPLLNSEGHYAGIIGHHELFPAAPAGSSFRFALSNGVAAALTFGDAARNARAELVERDRLLRSWFGRGIPPRLLEPIQGVPAIAEHYDVEAYDFPAQSAEDEAGLAVAGVFAFPKGPGTPLVYGSAAAATREEALGRATGECIQRLAFLWGETLPATPPEFEPTPGYHQEYYLCPQSHAALRAWLAGDNEERRPLRRLRARRPWRFAVVTPEHLLRRLCVVKALPDEELRLAFGHHPDVSSELGRRSVHPIA
jgi:hypothetical protein